MDTQKHASKGSNALAGLAIGLCNGLFGAGGGVVAVLALKRFCGLEAKEAHATAISIMLPLSAVSVAVYMFKGGMDYGALMWCAPGVLLGSLAGARLTGRIATRALELIFCAVTFMAGLWMVLR